jgi:uncharacterized protein (TIGR04141 family)
LSWLTKFPTASVDIRSGIVGISKVWQAVMALIAPRLSRVEFWIADTPRENGEFNIPFFSRISLRDELRNLQAMQYAVKIRFIGLMADEVRKSKKEL